MKVIYKTIFGLAVQEFDEAPDFQYLIFNDELEKKLEIYENPAINEDFTDIIELGQNN
jgi:guanylate kinase